MILSPILNGMLYCSAEVSDFRSKGVYGFHAPAMAGRVRPKIFLFPESGERICCPSPCGG
jgi:hypothetical protein